MRRAFFALPLAVAVIASCTNDFEAPFAQAGSSSSSSSSGSNGATEGGAGDGSIPDGGGGCTFTEDWEAPAKNTFPVSWLRLDESEPNDFQGTATSKVGIGYRKAGTKRIAYGAVRSPNGAQHMGSIGFSDVWPQLNGGVSGAISIAFWFRMPLFATESIVLASKRHDGPRKGVTIELRATGAIVLHRENEIQPWNYELGRISTTDGWDRWHHLVLQRTDAPKPLLQFYVDGIRREIVDDFAPGYAATEDPFVIGPFDGDVDEVMAWDRLITQTEVWALMDAAASGGCASGNRSVCYGPTAKGTCDNAKPVWSETCPDGQICMVKNGAPTCVVPEPCGK